MKDKDDGAWFAPKKYGYGAGLPIAWQGWVVLVVYTLAMLAPTPLIEWDPLIGIGFAIPLWLVATLVVTVVARRKTRGGWRFRDGDDE